MRLVALVLFLTQIAFAAEQEPEHSTIMNSVAESYVKLVLAVGRHDKDYVDAYFGPPEWRKEAEKTLIPLAQIQSDASQLLPRLQKADVSETDEMTRLRKEFLRKQIESLIARVEILAGKRMSFDEESEALYDAVAPSFSDDHFKSVSKNLESLLPGEGSLTDRYDDFRKGFVIPKEKLDAVFKAAIEECRNRTRRHIQLPQEESFEIEYVTGESWGAYNWYKGNSHSLIQINTDLPIYIDQPLGLASHEGYPGHHVYNVLLEKELLRKRNWIEFSVYPLFSPESLIAEGSADFGIEVLFSERERESFERNALFPLAGIPGKDAERYFRIRNLVKQLRYAGLEACRRYLDGRMTKEQTIAWLQENALSPQKHAEKRLRFFEQYRSYIINYSYGEDLVSRYIESRGGTAENPQQRWIEFERLLASPRLPSGL